MASSRSSASAEARARTLVSSPSRVRSGDAAAQQDRGRLEDPVVGALRQHDVLAAARARSISWYSNISGVRTSEADTLIAASSARWSTCSEKRRRATSSLRVDSFDIGPRTRDSRSAVVKVPSSVDTIGRLCGTPSSSRRTVLRDRVAAGQHDPGQGREGAGLVGHQQAGHQLAAVARRDHRDVGPQPGQHVRQAHRGHDQAQRLPVQPGVGAQHQLGVRRGLGLGPHRGGRQHRALRRWRRPPGRAAAPSGRRCRRPVRAVRLAITATGVGVVRPAARRWRPRRRPAPRRACGRGRARPAPPAAPRLAAIRALTVSSVPVEMSV